MDWMKSYYICDEPVEPLEFVPAPEVGKNVDIPDHFQNSLMIDTIHDGATIPRPFWDALMQEWGDNEEKMAEFDFDYVRERDWGSDLVATALVQALNRHGYRCEGYHRITIARVLMDFGRFPGHTKLKAHHLDRFAINYPFSYLLNYDLKKYLLESYYDVISQKIEPIVASKMIKFSIHTYDRYNDAGTERPLTSVINRPMSYQLHSTMPVDFFDPIFPPVLGEYTADRRLTHRLALMLERAGFPSADNYPYLLPSGSTEVRAQVWLFFHHLQKKYEVEFPATRESLAYQRVWAMLTDTNLRSAECENLRSYLHMFRRAPEGEEALYAESRLAYERIRDYIHHNEDELVKEYRRSSERPSCLGIEVRKDYVWEFADDECRKPIRPKPENAKKVADVLAKALIRYIREDRSEDEEQGI